MFEIIRKNKEIRTYYLLAIFCIIIDVILGSTALKGNNMLDISLTGGGGVGVPIILVLAITYAIFKVPNTKYDIIWQWIKTLLIVIVPFWFVFYMMFFDIMSYNNGSIAFFVYELLSVIAIIFTLKARVTYRKTDEFSSKQNVKNEKREKFEQELAQIRVESAMKKQQKMQDEEEKIRKAWEDYNENLINRGMHCYSVAFVKHKKYMGGRIIPRFFVEAINKDSALSEARKRLPIEAKHQTVTECIPIAGMRTLSYADVESKWKDHYLGRKEIAW